MGQQVQLEVGLGRAAQRRVFAKEGGDQRLVAFRQAGEQGRLGGVDAFQRFGQLAGLLGAEADRLVATAVAELFRGLGHQLAGRVEQGLGVEDFQPVALTVLGADTEGQAEQGRGYVAFLNANSMGVVQTSSAA
ncbi:hypothetical protein D9M68_834350 [compost metagenome]